MIVRILRMLCGVECKRWFGLRSLKTVEGDLIVQQNTVLKSLSGLLGVTSVGGPTSKARSPSRATEAAATARLDPFGRRMPVLPGERRSVRPVVGSDGISKRARYAAGRRWT